MPLFDFRARNPQRDRDTDLGRLDRLLQLLRQLRTEVETERSGLAMRYEKAQLSAAFALEAFENGGSQDLSSKADDLALSMRRYHIRIVALEEQIAFVDRAEAEAKAFYDALMEPGSRQGRKDDNSISNNVAPTAHD
ncbi:hypothetical protein [Nitratireductor luteus]|uniref:hypothetical protein n=1 Tax=Nitratireductor luteus TaxID=2976980 RepID=UPI00223EE7FD|nr:hypothetical protein [Nitratireductor luteus]